MAADVAAYMKYYNLKRLYTSNGDMTPVEYENYQLKKQKEIEEGKEGKIISSIYLKDKITIKKDYISVNENIFTNSSTMNEDEEVNHDAEFEDMNEQLDDLLGGTE